MPVDPRPVLARPGLIATVFLYGAGLVHVESFLATGNTAPANWGFTVLFGNGILPTVLLGLLAARRHPPAVSPAD